jgi:3-methyladenine DNA glycosylase AlkC
MSQSSEEKPTAFKHWINPGVVERMAQSLSAASSVKKFDAKLFLEVSAQLTPLELKQRVGAIRKQLRETLPQDYLQALRILVTSAERGDLKQFELWPYLDFIQHYGLEHVSESLEAMKQLTPLFSAEFAVRPFLARHPKQVFNQLRKWARDRDPHVRRWTSEGTRPRLPWGEKLTDSVKDPSSGLEILSLLKNDESLYVRKSVANHLNDIAKDHPLLVIRALKSWKREPECRQAPHFQFVLKHSLRSLVKQGHVDALALLGVDHNVRVAVRNFRVSPEKVRMPGHLELSFELQSKETRSQKIIVDYVIHYRKKNGELSPKVFKLKTLVLKPGEKISIQKKHPLKKITTRVYYSGLHQAEIQVSGKRLARLPWTLKV